MGTIARKHGIPAARLNRALLDCQKPEGIGVSGQRNKRFIASRSFAVYVCDFDTVVSAIPIESTNQ